MPGYPNFPELLAPHIAAVPPSAIPNFLARLEREAAERYRDWASHYEGEEREVILACAAREDEIADRVEALFSVGRADLRKIERALPGALEAYRGAFEGFSVPDQLGIQGDAELQGADAWRGIAAGQSDPEIIAGLAACSEIEEKSSVAVKKLLGR
jgi:hypothetical protein